MNNTIQTLTDLPTVLHNSNMSVILHCHSNNSIQTVLNTTTALHNYLTQCTAAYTTNKHNHNVYNQCIVDVTHSTNQFNHIISTIYNLPHTLIDKLGRSTVYNKYETTANHRQHYNIESYPNHNAVYICTYINTKLYRRQYKQDQVGDGELNERTECIDSGSDITHTDNINNDSDDITYNNAVYQCVYILDRPVIIQSIHKLDGDHDIRHNQLSCTSLYDIFDVLYIKDNIQYRTYHHEARRISELNKVLSIDEYTDLLSRIQLLQSNIISLLQHIKYITHVVNTLHTIHHNSPSVSLQSSSNTDGQYIDINTIYIEYNTLHDQSQSLCNFVELYLNDYRTRVLSYYSTKNQHVSIHIKHLAMLFFIFNTLNTIADLGGTNINIPYQHTGITSITQLIPFFVLCGIMMIWITGMYIMFKRYKLL